MMRSFWVICLLSFGTAFGESEYPAFWPATLLENAHRRESGAFFVYAGLEMEEDSGDFPTTKVVLDAEYGLSSRFVLRASTLLVRFNRGDYTAWGGADSSAQLRYQLTAQDTDRPSAQLKLSLFVPSGGMSSTRLAVAPGLNLSWRIQNWGVHLNGQYAIGAADRRSLGVSEVDRWRVASGADYLFGSSGLNWSVTVVGAQPIRPKPTEWTLENSIVLPLGSHWFWSATGAGGLREKGIEWLARTGLGYEF